MKQAGWTLPSLTDRLEACLRSQSPIDQSSAQQSPQGCHSQPSLLWKGRSPARTARQADATALQPGCRQGAGINRSRVWYTHQRNWLGLGMPGEGAFSAAMHDIRFARLLPVGSKPVKFDIRVSDRASATLSFGKQHPAVSVELVLVLRICRPRHARAEY